MSLSLIQSKADLAKIISKHIVLREGRKALRGNCPFHADQSDSFMVSPEKNVFKCFGCGKEGGPVEFVMWIENVSFDSASRRLAQALGITGE